MDIFRSILVSLVFLSVSYVISVGDQAGSIAQLLQNQTSLKELGDQNDNYAQDFVNQSIKKVNDYQSDKDQENEKTESDFLS